jgi:predicted SnoaL-like aldol condensation-catalyzing enzyme
VSEANITAANKALVLEAITGCFVDRDTSIPGKHFAPDYKQHNPNIPNGNSATVGLITALSPDFKYEPGMIVAEGEYVMIHGRYTGWGPKPMVAVDIFRVVDGKLVEHWDVMQEEVPAELTKSGNSMFTNPQRGRGDQI